MQNINAKLEDDEKSKKRLLGKIYNVALKVYVRIRFSKNLYFHMHSDH